MPRPAGAEPVRPRAERVGELDHRLLADEHEQGPVVGHDVAHDDGHDAVRELRADLAGPAAAAATGERRRGREGRGDQDDHAQQPQRGGHLGRERPVLQPRDPPGGAGHGVVGRRAEEHADHREQSRPGGRRGHADERVAQHQGAVGAAPQRREPAREGREQLEAVTAVEPRGPPVGRREQVHGDVGREERAQHRQAGALGRDQLEPHEGQQRQGPRPVAEPRRQRGDALLGPGADQPGHGPVHRPQRVQQAPDRAEQHRQQRHADPEQDVDGAGRRVQRVVAPEDRGHGDVGEGHQAQEPQRHPQRRAVQRPRQPGGQRPTGTGRVQPRLAPQQPQRQEGRHDRDGRAGDRVGERDRQVLPAADAVGEQLRPPTQQQGGPPGGDQRTSSWSRASAFSCVSTSNTPCWSATNSIVAVRPASSVSSRS